jgi:transposase
LRYVARTGWQWRFLPNDMPPWYVVDQQMQRWLRWGCFEILVEDVRSLVREWAGRKGQPTAVCIDSRTLQSTPESGARAGYDGAKRRKGSKVHSAVDTLGHLLARTVTPASQGDRTQVAALAEQVQQVTGNSVELAFVDQGYTGPNAAEAAQQHGLQLEVVKHPMAKRGFVLLPRRWVVERSFAWAARFRRLARDYERLATTLKGLHLLAFATLILLPQIECALRNLLGLLGRPTNKAVRGESRVMQERNMNEALGDQAVRAVLPEDLQRRLQIVFASRLGFNLRNVVAHGLLPASQFSILTNLMALQGLLLMSLIQAKRRLSQRKLRLQRSPRLP